MKKHKKDSFFSFKYLFSDFVRINGGIKYKLFYRPKIYYEDNATLDIKGKVIVTSNHNDPVEPPTIFTLFLKRRLFFVIAKELVNNRKQAWFYKKMNCTLIDRDNTDLKGLKQLINHLNHDRLLVIFPEGAMSEDNTNLPFKQGAAMLSLYTNTPLLPLYIQHGKENNKKIYVCVGKYFYPKDITDGKKTKENIELITNYLYEKTFEMKTKLNENYYENNK